MTASSPSDLYAAHLDVLRERAQTALERGGFEHLLVPSGSPRYQQFDDRQYPYAVNPQFKAWLPMTDAPDSWIAFTPGERPKLIYLQPHDYWHAAPEDPAGYWAEHFDIRIIRQPEEAAQHLPAKHATCAILGPPSGPLSDYTANNPQPILDYLDYHRAYKTPYEVAMMREATRIGVRAHRAAERAFRAGASEFGIHLAYCQAAGQDVDELPYGNIIAQNAHAAILHYTRLQRLPPKPLRNLLIDAGASHGGYACDITRSHVAEGDEHDEFRAMIAAVDAAQRKMCEQVRRGVDYRRLHLDAHLALADVLRQFGLLKATPEAALANGVSRAFFPHGIGHGIGLQVHDVGGLAESDRGGVIAKPDDHPHLRLTRTLDAGMVVTIEPGIYFIDMLLERLRANGKGSDIDWQKVEKFKPYGGIRIEDDVVCTDGDPLNLTREEFASQL